MTHTFPQQLLQMTIPFYKFDGAGNDFVIVDNRRGDVALGDDEVARICHRRFGVGADGLMLLGGAEGGCHFRMVYYNSDGHQASMCGNGGRCIAAFAAMLGLGDELCFEAFDGVHRARIVQWDGRRGVVDLGMRDVEHAAVRQVEGGWMLDTGSPHFVLPVSGLADCDVVAQGRRWRQRADLFPEGANIDFVERLDDGSLAIRTYERGVEDETWACGTGVTASAIATGAHSVRARGGDFEVLMHDDGHRYADIHLIGPVAFNFKGEWTSSVR